MANEEQIKIGYYIRVICSLLHNNFSGLNSKEYGVNFFKKRFEPLSANFKKRFGSSLKGSYFSS